MNENELNKHIKHLDTIGIHSVRYNTMLALDNSIIFAIGVCLEKYSLTDHKFIKKVKIGNSVIQSLSIRDNIIFASTNSETVCLLDTDLNILSKLNLTGALKLRHSDISLDKRIITCLSYECIEEGMNHGTGAMFILSCANSKLEVIKKLTGDFIACIFNSKNELVLIEVLNIDMQKYYSISVYSIDNNNELVSLRNTLIEVFDDFTTLTHDQNKLIINFHKRNIFVLDLETLLITNKIFVEGAGILGDVALQDNTVYITPFRNILISLDLNQIEGEYTIHKDLYKNKGVTVISTQIKDLVVMNASLKVNHKLCFYANENGLFCTHLETKDEIISFHNRIRITGCGIVYLKADNLIIIGDLEFNISVVRYDYETGSYEHLEKIFIGEGIRCLTVDSENKVVYIGTMNGTVYSYEILKDTHFKSRLTKLIHLRGSVNSIKFFIVEKNYTVSRYLIVGTSKGLLSLYKIKDKTDLYLFHCFIAHEPVEGCDEEKFGSLPYWAEIWSVCINNKSSLCNKEGYTNTFHIVTCSEDQCIKIWEYDIDKNYNPKHISCFKKHDLAVTAVDWKNMGDNILDGEVLASCSDDRTINLYNPKKNFEHVKTLSTRDYVHDWHTITYMGLEENGFRLACGTQNGYLVIWDLNDFSVVFCEKLHIGGIEGLYWEHDVIITCSSDLNITYLQLK
jgi:WD40 repeat protein